MPSEKQTSGCLGRSRSGDMSKRGRREGLQCSRIKLLEVLDKFIILIEMMVL